MGKEKKQQNSSAAFKVGAVSLAFLIIGYQAAIFVHRAAQLRIEANRDAPDTVYVYVNGAAPAAASKADAAVRDSRKEADLSGEPGPTTFISDGAGSLRAEGGGSDGWGSAQDGGDAQGWASSGDVEREDRHYAEHSAAVQKVRDASRRVESFRFDPNTAGLEDFKRLGFSEKQAQSILNYRAKGGRFRRKQDFARSFVVADSVYARLEPYIEIPLLDINKADSAAFDALPGIGPWFAAKMVEYREKIGGYTSTEQLMDIDRFDSERYEALADLVTCGPVTSGSPLTSGPTGSPR